MRIADLMTTPTRTCNATAPMSDAARIMWEEDCGAVPVIADDGRLCGIITDRDLCMACYLTGGDMHELAVRDAMSKKAYSCQPGDDVRVALVLMRRAQVRRVPVIDASGRPCGIVSIGDLARISSVPGTEDLVPDSGDVMSVLADICEPRSASGAST